jgi:hypothetical protein
METLNNFKKYSTPKLGIFNIDTNQYKNGWVCEEQKHLIIGEDDYCFVTRLIKGGHGEWVGDVVIERKYILPIGIHKSRLVRWISGLQLEIFQE